MTDPIADMLTRIRNAHLVKRPKVAIPHSKVKEAILKTLETEHYIESFQVLDTTPAKTLDVTLKYVNNLPAITNLKRMSKPGRRLYAKKDALVPQLSGFGITIVSTSKGVMSDKVARSQQLGGEVLCQVW
jgi:small subunit ribosomal protein S8